MKIITMCGSMKFAEQMKQIAWKLETEQGFNVLQCVYNERNEPVTEDMLKRLASAHKNKIDLCNAVYIVDIDDYIGASVQQEILYAKENGKELIFHSRQVSLPNVF